MELEEILQKYIEAKRLLESNALLVATGLINIDANNDLRAAEALLAETTRADADLLAKTTKADAEILAKATQQAADQLMLSNKASVRWMTTLTIAMLAVGLIQLAIAIMPLMK